MSLASFWARKHRREKIRSEEPIENFFIFFCRVPGVRVLFSLAFLCGVGAPTRRASGDLPRLARACCRGCASGVVWPLGVVHVLASLPRLMWWLSLRVLSI